MKTAIIYSTLIDDTKKSAKILKELIKSDVVLKNIENVKDVCLLKYNFIHFTSIQSLSNSDNLFCLKDQNEISDLYFEEKL